MNENDEKHLEFLLRHIHHVQNNCLILGHKLALEEKEVDFGKQLISNSFLHDNSKFNGNEWLFLRDGIPEEKFKDALNQHQTTNPHHPEYWHGIENMPRIYIAEMCCDWYARSSEFASDLWDWIKEKACKRYDFSYNSQTYKQIKYFLTLLLEKKFG